MPLFYPPSRPKVILAIVSLLAVATLASLVSVRYLTTRALPPDIGSVWSPLVVHAKDDGGQIFHCFDNGSSFCETSYSKLTVAGYLAAAASPLGQPVYSCNSSSSTHTITLNTSRCTTSPYVLGKTFATAAEVPDAPAVTLTACHTGPRTRLAVNGACDDSETTEELGFAALAGETFRDVCDMVNETCTIAGLTDLCDATILSTCGLLTPSGSPSPSASPSTSPSSSPSPLPSPSPSASPSTSPSPSPSPSASPSPSPTPPPVSGCPAGAVIADDVMNNTSLFTLSSYYLVNGWQSPVSGGYNGTYRIHDGSLSNYKGYARWRFPNFSSGKYDLYATWVPPVNNPASTMQYEMPSFDSSYVSYIYINPSLEPRSDMVCGGRPWQKIRSYSASLTGSPFYVWSRAISASGATVRETISVDAVMLVPAP